MIIKQPKWKNVGSFQHATKYKGRKVDLRWFKKVLAISIDNGYVIMVNSDFEKLSPKFWFL